MRGTYEAYDALRRSAILLIKGINSINRVLDLEKEGLAGAGLFFLS